MKKALFEKSSTFFKNNMNIVRFVYLNNSMKEVERMIDKDWFTQEVRLWLLNVKLLWAVLGVVQQQLTRLKVRSVDVGEAVHHIDGRLRAHSVHEAEWSTEEWRKAQAENGTNVAFKLQM